MVTAAAALLRAAPPKPQTFVYKKVADCQIKVDVFAMPGSGRKPVAVWIHGGALIFGSRC
jgi:carboxylesterase type B